MCVCVCAYEGGFFFLFMVVFASFNGLVTTMMGPVIYVSVTRCAKGLLPGGLSYLVTTQHGNIS